MCPAGARGEGLERGGLWHWRAMSWATSTFLDGSAQRGLSGGGKEGPWILDTVSQSHQRFHTIPDCCARQECLERK